MIDYLIVGSGLAGIAFAETALRHEKSLLVVDADLFKASKVAAGLYNPVALKRFGVLQGAQEQLDLLISFYNDIEGKLNEKFNFKIPVLRKFSSTEEQNNWFIASDKLGLSSFLSTELIFEKYSGIDSPFGYGKVNETGCVNTALLLEKYQAWLLKNNLLLKEAFDHSILEIHSDFIQYKNIEAKHIVFAEGFGMHANPFFRELPLDGAKGEILIIRAPQLSLDVILNTNLFILPLGNSLFKIGATYNWTDKTEIPTQDAKFELTERLKEIITCNFEIIEHHAGVRPTVKDRKPLIGTHYLHQQVHILNGLGTRGVMLAPAMAKILFESIEFGIPLPKEINIRRFDKKK